MSEGKLVKIKTEEILTDLSQPRKRFDCYDISLLAESVRENGIIEPLLIRPAGEGKFLLVSGERRLRAAKMLGLKRVPVIIRRLDDITADGFRLTENLQRRELSLFEEAEGINDFIKKYNLTVADAAERLGISGNAVSAKLELLALTPPLRKSIEAARLTERHARALLKIPNEERAEMLEIIIANQLTASETESKIARRLSSKKEPKRRCAIADPRLFYNSINKMVDTMRQGGISAEATAKETDAGVEYTVVIKK